MRDKTNKLSELSKLFETQMDVIKLEILFLLNRGNILSKSLLMFQKKREITTLKVWGVYSKINELFSLSEEQLKDMKLCLVQDSGSDESLFKFYKSMDHQDKKTATKDLQQCFRYAGKLFYDNWGKYKIGKEGKLICTKKGNRYDEEVMKFFYVIRYFDPVTKGSLPNLPKELFVSVIMQFVYEQNVTTKFKNQLYEEFSSYQNCCFNTSNNCNVIDFWNSLNTDRKVILYIHTLILFLYLQYKYKGWWFKKLSKVVSFNSIGNV